MTQCPIPGDASTKIFNHALVKNFVKLCRNFDADMIKLCNLLFSTPYTIVIYAFYRFCIFYAVRIQPFG